jgi:Zn-dependent protease
MSNYTPEPSPLHQPVVEAVSEPETPDNTSQAAQPNAPAASRLDGLKRWGSWGAVAFLVLKKLGVFLKASKAVTLLSMFFAIWIYAKLWGWAFGLGFVLLIFVHELGHAIAMKRMGIPAGAPVFIPFVGAVIAMRGMPRDAYVEAFVGIAGPILGTIGALACLGMALVQGSPYWYALATTGFLLNLFNLLPVSPLDGGRVVPVMSRWFWVVGYALGAVLYYYSRSSLLLMILLLSLFSLPQRLRTVPKGYFDISTFKRLAMASTYFGLILFLAAGTWFTRGKLNSIKHTTQMATTGAILLASGLPALWFQKLLHYWNHRHGE